MQYLGITLAGIAFISKSTSSISRKSKSKVLTKTHEIPPECWCYKGEGPTEAKIKFLTLENRLLSLSSSTQSASSVHSSSKQVDVSRDDAKPLLNDS